MASPTKSAEQPLPLTMCSKMPFKIVRRAFMMHLRDHAVTLYHYVHSFSQDGIMEDHFMLIFHFITSCSSSGTSNFEGHGRVT